MLSGLDVRRRLVRGWLYVENVVGNFVAPKAAGLYSVAIMRGAKAAGQDSLAAGFNASAAGQQDTAIGPAASTNNGSTAVGWAAATGTTSIAIGPGSGASNPSATGGNAFAAMQGASSQGSSSVVIANNGVAASNFGLAFGWQPRSNDIAQEAFAGPGFGSSGDVQRSTYLLTAAVTNATPIVMTADGGAAGGTNQVVLSHSSARAVAYDGLIVARQREQDGTASAAWAINGLIRIEGGAAATVLVAHNETPISNVPGWAVTVTADTTNGALTITFTGAASTNVKAVAMIRTVELYYFT